MDRYAMTNADSEEEVMEFATPETLRPLVQKFLDQLTTVQLDNLQCGFLDTPTEIGIRNMSVELMNLLTIYIFEGPPMDTVMLERQVLDCLGDTIIAEAIGAQRNARGQSTKRVTNFLAEDLTDSSEEHSKPCMGRLTAMVRCMIKILSNSAGTINCKGKPCPGRGAKASAEDLDGKPFGVGSPQKCSSEGSFVREATEAVMSILEKRSANISQIYSNESKISAGEYDMLVAINTRYTNETASEIVHTIMKELQLDLYGSPMRRLESQTTMDNRVGRLVESCMFHRLAREKIISSMAKLRSDLGAVPLSGHVKSMELLIEKVDCLVEGLIPPERDGETSERKGNLYNRIAKDISGGQHYLFATELSEVMYDHLKPEVGGKKVGVVAKIKMEMNAFIERMRQWFRQKRIVQIKGFVGSLTSITEALAMESWGSSLTIEVIGSDFTLFEAGEDLNEAEENIAEYATEAAFAQGSVREDGMSFLTSVLSTMTKPFSASRSSSLSQV